MKAYQTAFIDTALEANALCFGDYTLKSGRNSPYFFNAGLLYQGKALATLANCYAQAIIDSKISFDVLFGPAYKGISLAAITAAALYQTHGIDVPFAYNRKEKKTHGEGGQTVGAALQGKKVLIIDDVITAGTAIREVTDLLATENAELAGVVIGLNREERGKSELSAIQEVERDFGVSVASIIRLQDIIEYLARRDDASMLQRVRDYQQQYGVDTTC
ncbi:Orotate phosphoribosyltransferase [BD1-7 clade bacterium]|uniref:Orotate phosphoribosyltransferase n=1 Tax=BD1-7 clade bacterium TaxID=2029982 RepID=A0A5S9N435_9GAMM|nr:Orotate phosphoribosyltransferase [BD1-7 clade bacterium]CAA0082707.1 Orotate phosphoribosyltransferase [BD1-7 clade bacterium]